MNLIIILLSAPLKKNCPIRILIGFWKLNKLLWGKLKFLQYSVLCSRTVAVACIFLKCHFKGSDGISCFFLSNCAVFLLPLIHLFLLKPLPFHRFYFPETCFILILSPTPNKKTVCLHEFTCSHSFGCLLLPAGCGRLLNHFPLIV